MVRSSVDHPMTDRHRRDFLRFPQPGARRLHGGGQVGNLLGREFLIDQQGPIGGVGAQPR